MKRRFYGLIRDLHLYIGLFISPFVLAFSISVFFLVHSWLPKLSPETSTTRVVSDLPLSADLNKLSGRPLIDALKPALQAADVHGEVGFVRHLIKEEQLIIPVTIPGRETTVSINIPKREAAILTRGTGLAAALVTLHKSPGQHGADIRMNWFYRRAWRWLADATVYLVLFISVSGIYLWYVLRAERLAGFILLCVGALWFFGIAYALLRNAFPGLLFLALVRWFAACFALAFDGFSEPLKCVGGRGNTQSSRPRILPPQAHPVTSGLMG